MEIFFLLHSVSLFGFIVKEITNVTQTFAGAAIRRREHFDRTKSCQDRSVAAFEIIWALSGLLCLLAKH